MTICLDIQADPKPSFLKTSLVVRLEQLTVQMYLGLHDFEQEATQRVAIDVELTVSDPDLFWDYDGLRNFLRAHENRRIDTQENLCSGILEYIFAQGNVAKARVWTRKPDIFPEAASVGIEMSATCKDACN